MKLSSYSKLLAFLALAHFLTDAAQGAVPALGAYLESEYAWSYSRIGALALVTSVGSALLQPLAGIYGDRTKNGVLIPVGLLLAGGGMIFAAFVAPLPWIFAAVAVTGAGVALFHPDGMRAAHFVIGRRRATGMAFFQVGGNLGFAVGPTVAAFGLSFFGPVGLVLAGLPAVLWAGVMSRLAPTLRRTWAGRDDEEKTPATGEAEDSGAASDRGLPEDSGAASDRRLPGDAGAASDGGLSGDTSAAPGSSAAESRTVPGGSAAEGRMAPGRSAEGGQIAQGEPRGVSRTGPTAAPQKDRWVAQILVLTVSTLRSIFQFALITFVPVYAMNVLGGSYTESSMMGSLYMASGAIGTLLGGPLADRFGLRRFVRAALLLVAPIHFAMLAATGPWVPILLALQGGILVSTMAVTILLSQSYVPNHLALVSGLNVGLGIATGGAGAALVGLAADVWGLVPVLTALAALPLLAGLLTFTLPQPEASFERESSRSRRTAGMEAARS